MKTYNTRIKIVFFTVLFGISFFQLHAERYVITTERFEITGRTRESAVKSEIGSSQDKTFNSRTEVEKHLADQRQKLENIRSFKKSSISATYAEPAENSELIEVSLTIKIEDGSVFLPIPYAFYNSNEGFQAGLIINLPNLAGTLSDMVIVSLYGATPDENDTLQWTDPNFMLLTALNNIPVGIFNVGASASIMKMNQKIVDRGIQGVRAEVLGGSGSLNFELPLTNTISNTTGIRFAGSGSSEIVSMTNPDLLAYGPIKKSITVQNALAYKNVNWDGNFRRGWKSSLQGSFTRSDPFERNKTNDFLAEAEIAGFTVWNNIFNPSFRLYTFANTGLPLLNTAFYTRGIRNTELKANTGVFLNTGIQTRLFQRGGVELHLTPIVDLMWVYVYKDAEYTNDIGLGIGGDILLIFDNLKTLPIKLGFAWDTRPANKIGGGNRMEVDFSFSFAY